MSGLDYIIKTLLAERTAHKDIAIPPDIEGKRRLMRSLLNMRRPKPVSDEFLRAQDAELQMQKKEKGVVCIDTIPSPGLDSRIKLWQGDITRLEVDAIVNAANNAMLGCFIPLHACIDNAIHSAAGVQLRQECYQLMRQQGEPEATGSAKITKGYNLPAKYVIHTVGPVVYSEVTRKEENQLADCYKSCLKIADEHNLRSIAFCCISTGEYRFPNQRAAEIAVLIVTDYLKKHPDTHIQTVLFNVFKDTDLSIYTKLLH